MESPEFDCSFKIFWPDNIPYVEFAVLHTYMYHLCLHDGGMSNSTCILGGHCYMAAIELFNDDSHFVGASIGVSPAAIWIFGKSNNELVIGIHMGTGEVLSVYDSFQAVASLLIAGRFKLRSGHVVEILDC